MRRMIALGAATLGCIAVVTAQTSDCPALVQEALSAAETLCSPTERNEVCYGNVQIEATLADSTLPFANQGDIVPLANIERLQLAGLNTEKGTWGVALLRVQADIPDSLPGQNVTFLLFGESEMENLAGAESPMRAVYFKSGVGSSACTMHPMACSCRRPMVSKKSASTSMARM